MRAPTGLQLVRAGAARAARAALLGLRSMSRRHGEVILSGIAGDAAQAATGDAVAAQAPGEVWLGPLPDGDYVVSQTVGDQRSRLSSPVRLTTVPPEPEPEPEPEPGPGPEPQPEPQPEPVPVTAGPADPVAAAPERAAPERPSTVLGERAEGPDRAGGRLPRTGSALTPLVLAGLIALGMGASSRVSARVARRSARHLRRT